jgi:hypothetical protein
MESRSSTWSASMLLPAVFLVPASGAPAAGDSVETDGMMAVLVLR